MTRKHHHTGRQVTARGIALKGWRKGRKKAGLPEPTDEERSAWVTGFNTAYKIGRKHAINPISQESPYKETLKKLYHDEISLDEAVKLTGLTKDKIWEKLDKYTFIPSLKQMEEVAKTDMETLKYLQSLPPVPLTSNLLHSSSDEYGRRLASLIDEYVFCDISKLTNKAIILRNNLIRFCGKL